MPVVTRHAWGLVRVKPALGPVHHEVQAANVWLGVRTMGFRAPQDFARWIDSKYNRLQ